MLPKKFRLTRQEFNVVKSQGKLFRNFNYTTYTHPNNNPHYRLSVVVSKKISKLATRRNSLRRTVYRHFKSPIGFDTIIVLHPSMGHMTTPEIANLFGGSKIR